MRNLKIEMLLLVVVMAMASACQKNITTLPSASQEPVLQPLKIPNDFSDEVFYGLKNAETVFDMYRRQHFEPLWISSTMPSPKADSLMNIIKTARRYGLLPHDYHLKEIEHLAVDIKTRPMLIRLDAILTDAFFSMAADLKYGRANLSGSPRVDSAELITLRDSLSVQPVRGILEMQEPKYAGYAGLKKALNRILDSISPADQALLMSGITNDSVPIHRTIKQVEINMERWRNEKEALNGTYAWVNVPAFMFYTIEQNMIALESRVIVGTPAAATPLFSSKIECFTIFPYWYVPRKITVKEYLPLIKKDTTFITRNNFDVLDRDGRIQPLSSIDWNQYTASNFPFTLRQREGTENSLGVIKFVFDNPYAVFLHDTNAKRLFKNKQRAYSHGCIRLEKAFDFAHYLIGGKRTRVSKTLLNRYLSEQKRRTITLAEPVPIHIRYFTAEEKDGVLLLYEDIYKKDRALMQLLYNQSSF